MLVFKHLTLAIDLKTKKLIATINCLVINILQNVYFCVQQKKETHKGLEQHEGE